VREAAAPPPPAAAPAAGDAASPAAPAAKVRRIRDLDATLTLGPIPGALPAVRRTAARPMIPDGAAAATVAPAEAPAAIARGPQKRIELSEEERAELSAGSGPAAQERHAPATLAEVEAAFAATADREEVARILLAYLARSYRRVALFHGSRRQIAGWMAHGEGVDQEAFAQYTVGFKEPSVFLNLLQGSGNHIGPLPPMQAHRRLALCWGGGLPRDCIVLPVRLRDRLVTVIYLDGGSRGLWGIDLDEMQRLTAATATAFEHCILTKKRGYPQS
jgi:hypothetical protein